MKGRPLTFAFLATLLVASCIGGPGNAGVAWLRNESSEPVETSIEQSSRAGLNPVFGGKDKQVHVIPPWQEGWCETAGYGIYSGPVTISISGEMVPFPISTTVDVPDTPQTHITVTVDAAGEVHFGEEAPTRELPCEGYPEVAPTSSP